MTILTPHKNSATKHFILLLFTLLLVGGVLYIFEYNALVNARFALSGLKKDIVDLETKNADLKNQLYAALDPVKLNTFASASGLILERKPQYLTQWVSDSSY
jgi:hypothetical protein